MSKKISVDKFLHEIEKNFISLKDSASQFVIFKNVFDQIHEKIKEVDPYYERYSSKVQYAGSFYDGVKVGQLDEFDMDIIIRLPVNYDEIIIENEMPGFVTLKIESPFDNLDKMPDWESHNKVTRDWRDSDKYFLQSQFRQWMEGAVNRAINKLERKVVVNGEAYKLSVKKSGPAFTVNVKNAQTNVGVDVDIVPVIQFQFKHWPAGYRKKENEGDQNKNTWCVVPKPHKDIVDAKVQNRCWRLAFHDQEKEIIKGCEKLKPTLKWLKKLRDSMGMKGIASYYIKTLFLWTVDKPGHDKSYWKGKQSVIFKDMVQNFHDALKAKNIPYFWNEKYNLIGAVKEDLLILYKGKLKKLLEHLEENSITDIVKALLTVDEFEKFKNVEIYKAYVASMDKVPALTPMKKSTSTISLSANEKTEEKKEPKSPGPKPAPTTVSAEVHTLLNGILKSNNNIEKMLKTLLGEVATLQDRFKNLELQVKSIKQAPEDVLLFPSAVVSNCPVVPVPAISELLSPMPSVCTPAAQSFNQDLHDLLH